MAARRKTASRKGQSAPGLVWLFAGILIGLGLAWYLWSKGYIPQPRTDSAATQESSAAVPADGEEVAPAAEEPKKSRYDFFTVLPEMEVVVPDEEDLGHSLLLQKSTKEKPAGIVATVPAGIWYLQAGSFREKARADELKVKLTGLGFKCDIREVSIDDMEVFYHVRVGPFADLEALNKLRQKLDELGVETQMIKERK